MRKGFVLTVDFTEFSMSKMIIIGPEFMMPSQKSVCTVLQTVGLSAGHRTDNQPCYPPEAGPMLPCCVADGSRASSTCPSGEFSAARTPGCSERSHDLQITAQRPLAWDGCCPLPAQGTPQRLQRQKVRYPNPRLTSTQPFVPWMCR